MLRSHGWAQVRQHLVHALRLDSQHDHVALLHDGEIGIVNLHAGLGFQQSASRGERVTRANRPGRGDPGSEHALDEARSPSFLNR